MAKIRVAALEEETGKRVVSAMLQVERANLTGTGTSSLGPTLEWWAAIDANATLSTGKYKYGWTEQYRTATGWETNAAIARSGTTSSGWAVNACEPTAGPIRTGSIVRMRLDYSPTGGAYLSCAVPSNPLLLTISTMSSVTATQWVYTASDPTGATVSPLYNGFEPCVGSPGPLGITVGATGQVSTGTCVVKPIGPGARVLAVPGTGNTWLFSAPNSAS